MFSSLRPEVTGVLMFGDGPVWRTDSSQGPLPCSRASQQCSGAEPATLQPPIMYVYTLYPASYQISYSNIHLIISMRVIFMWLMMKMCCGGSDLISTGVNVISYIPSSTSHTFICDWLFLHSVTLVKVKVATWTE